MAPLLDRLAPGARVAAIRLRSLGDCVLTTPALDILHHARPDLRIAVVVEDRFRAVYDGNPHIEEILTPSVRELRRWQPALTWNLHGGTSSAQLTALSGARWRAGFQHYRLRSLYNVSIPRAQEILGTDRKVHTAEHIASAAFHMGAPRVEIGRAQLFCDVPSPSAPYAVIHPVAATPSKSWPADRFLACAAALHDLEPVFIAGPGEDLSAFQPHRCIAGAPLSEIKTLIRGASLFLGNDSGPAHIAAAFGIPVVTIFGPSDPDIWRPWRTPSEVLHADPIEGVSTEQVMAALDRLRVHA